MIIGPHHRRPVRHLFGASVLISAVETVVLPRNGYTRIARCVFAVANRILVHKWRNKDRRTNLRALYAPVALVSLPLVWMLSVTFGFSFIFWGIKSGKPQRVLQDQRVVPVHVGIRRARAEAAGSG